MSSLLNIATSGIQAASTALDVTSQNIANVSTAGYVDEGIASTELDGTTTGSASGNVSLFGVGPVTVTRDVNPALQSQARSAASAAASADAQVTGLTQVQSALEQTNLYPSITAFETSLQQLTSDPTDSSLRTSALSAAQDMAQTFNLASTQMTTAQQGLQADATAGVTQMNQLAGSLATLNVKIAANSDPASDTASLLDQRDALLQQMSQIGDITTTIAPNNTVQVQLGGASGPSLVSAGTASTLAMTTAADGTVAFTLGGAAINLAGGSLAGQQQSLATLASTGGSLDAIAASLATGANAAQAGGVALDGTAGQPLFSGTSAATIGVALTSGDQLATAPAGAAAASIDPTNLAAIQAAVQTADPDGQVNALLTTVSSAVHNATTSQTTLDAISTSAQSTLQSQSGVNLNTEAAKLLQYQQAYQASSTVIQAAQTIFTSLLQAVNVT